MSSARSAASTAATAIGDRSADRLRDEANRIERAAARPVAWRARLREARDIEVRIARLEQRIQYRDATTRYDRRNRDRW